MYEKIISTVTLILISLACLTGLQAQEPIIGEIKMFAGNFAPYGWAKCEGQLLSISGNEALFSIIGITYGGDNRTTFALPDLRGRAAIGAGQGPALADHSLGSKAGSATVTLNAANLPAHDHQVPGYNLSPAETDETHKFEHGNKSFISIGNEANSTVAIKNEGGSAVGFSVTQPSLAAGYIIALVGIFPSKGDGAPDQDAMLGEIKMFAGGFAIKGWAKCDGQHLQIRENEALFSIIGAKYGGDGNIEFALPDLRSRIPMGAGQGPGLSDRVLGTKPGFETMTLGKSNLPSHSYNVPAYDLNPSESDETHHFTHGNNSFISVGNNPDTQVAAEEQGESESFSIMQPTQAIQYLISTGGRLPTRE